MACTTKLVMTAPATGGRSALLTVEEVAELLKVPVSWVYDRTRSRGMNRIPGFRLGKYWRFQESEVLVWLERQRSGGRANA
jgi:excisionase family DNA binding protein